MPALSLYVRRQLAIALAAGGAIAVLVGVGDGAADGTPPPQPTVTVAGPPGPPGPQGDKGPQGDTGPRGPRGFSVIASSGSSLSFAEPSYSASEDQLDQGVRVDVRNDSGEPLRVTVVPALGGLPADVLRVSRPQDIGPGGTESFTLTGAPGFDVVADGSYAGSLAAWAPDGLGAARVPLAVDKPGGAIAPKPLTTKQTVQAVRWIPFWDTKVEIRGSWLPLAAGIPTNVEPDQLALPSEDVIGSVSGDKGGVAAVRYVRDTKKLPARVAGLKFAASGFDGPGNYTGTVDLLPGDTEAGASELTIVTKDAILWPILALGIGLWAALWARQWGKVDRLLLQWRRQLSAKREAHAAAQQQLRKHATGPWGNYDTTASFNDKADDLAGLLDGIRLGSFGEIAEGRETKVRNALERLDGYTAQLSGLDARAAALKGALESVERLGPIDLSGFLGMPALPPRPAFVPPAQDLLNGRQVSVEELDRRAKEIDRARHLAEDWPGWHWSASEAFEWLSELNPEDSNRPVVVAARGSLTNAWQGLWTSSDLGVARQHAGELEEAVSAVRNARGQLARPVLTVESVEAPGPTMALPDLAHRAGLERDRPRMALTAVVLVAILLLVAVVLTGIALFGLLPTGVALGAVAVAAVVAWLLSIARNRGIFSDDPLKRGDAWMTLAGWVVALATGLTALYFGKTFGTPTDYLIAILWGLTTMAAIDALAQVLRDRRAS